MKDIIILVADSYQEKVLEALLPRVPISSGTRPFTYEFIRNPGHDSGAYNDSHELLRPYSKQYSYALVLMDYEGCGVEYQKSAEEVEQYVAELLDRSGWENRNKVVVITPELETWMWMDNQHVTNAIGWEQKEGLYEWARRNGYIGNEVYKPERPKETLEKALKLSGTPKSAAVYKKIAMHASYKKCEDKAFIGMIGTLQEWFPVV